MVYLVEIILQLQPTPEDVQHHHLTTSLRVKCVWNAQLFWKTAAYQSLCFYFFFEGWTSVSLIARCLLLLSSCIVQYTSQDLKLDRKVFTVQLHPLSEGPTADQGSHLTGWLMHFASLSVIMIAHLESALQSFDLLWQFVLMGRVALGSCDTVIRMFSEPNTMCI